MFSLNSEIVRGLNSASKEEIVLILQSVSVMVNQTYNESDRLSVPTDRISKIM